MRFVEERVVTAGAGRLRSGDAGSDTKEYLERVAKYVPAEIIAAYISASGAATAAQNARALLILIFVICVICTPLYVTRFTNTKKESWTNSIMAVLAFVVWAYATGGSLFTHLGWYDAPTASVVLVLFSLMSGAVTIDRRAEPPGQEIQTD